MRIGIDARELSGRTTGVGRYLAGLLREWSANPAGDGHEFVLYAPELPQIPMDPRRMRHRRIEGAPGTWWEQVQLPPIAAKDHLDLFFAPAYTAPLRLDVPTVVTIHDLSYVAHPEWFGTREGIRRRWLTARSARQARQVITVSEFSKREIVERLTIAPGRVHVIPQGIDAPPVGRTAEAQDEPRDEPRVLYVGSIFNRRHIPDLVRAMTALRGAHPDASLDLAGDNRTFPFEDVSGLIERSGQNGRIRWHQYASAEDLAELYRRARAFVFLSEYEGLGTTPLEALAASVPPVVGDTAVARETYGEAALYVPVGDVPGTTQALERVLFDRDTRASILSAAPATLRKFDWRRAAIETMAVLESAV